MREVRHSSTCSEGGGVSLLGWSVTAASLWCGRASSSPSSLVLRGWSLTLTCVCWGLEDERVGMCLCLTIVFSIPGDSCDVLGQTRHFPVCGSWRSHCFFNRLFPSDAVPPGTCFLFFPGWVYQAILPGYSWLVRLEACVGSGWSDWDLVCTFLDKVFSDIQAALPQWAVSICRRVSRGCSSRRQFYVPFTGCLSSVDGTCVQPSELLPW